MLTIAIIVGGGGLNKLHLEVDKVPFHLMISILIRLLSIESLLEKTWFDSECEFTVGVEFLWSPW